MTATRFFDAREPGERLAGWSVSSRVGMLASELGQIRAGAEHAVPGGSMEVRGVGGFVTSSEVKADPTGWLTTVKGLSWAAKYGRYAPRKTLIYMSMSPEEKKSFDFVNRYTYDHLEYVPMIRVGDRYGRRGWYANDVIKDLVSRIPGLGCVVNTYNYMVRQVVAECGRSYLDTVLSLVSFMEPIVYEDGGTLYIVQQPLRGGSVEISAVSGVRHSIVYNPESRAERVIVQGGLGEFRPDKYRGYKESSRGDAVITDRVVDGGNEAAVTERYSREIDGSFRCLRYRKTLNRQGEDAWREETASFTYENDDVLRYEHPRLLKEEKTAREAVRYMVGLREIGSDYCPMYVTALRETREVVSYRYSSGLTNAVGQWVPEGSLLSVHRQVWGPALMVKRAYGESLREPIYSLASDADSAVFISILGEDMDVVVKEAAEGVTVLYLDEVMEYVQNTRDTYLERRRTRRSKPSWSGEQEFVYSSGIELRRGRIPQTPSTPRRMNVYAEWGSPEPGTMEEAAIVVSNANLIDWDDAEQVLGIVKRNRVDKSADVTVDVVVPADFSRLVTVGQRMSVGSIVLGDGSVMRINGDMYVHAVETTRDQHGVVSAVQLRGRV
jgi:hypothetical protein